MGKSSRKLVIWILHIKLSTMWMRRNVVKTMPSVSWKARLLLPELGLKEDEILGEGLLNVFSVRLLDTQKASVQWIRAHFGVTTVRQGSITHIDPVLKMKIKSNLRRTLRIKRTRKTQSMLGSTA